MAAVANRSYPAALVLFDAAQRVAKESSDDVATQKKTLMSMIFPASSVNGDNSPMHVICCNDTCSFTWTGAEHINQVGFLYFCSQITVFIHVGTLILVKFSLDLVTRGREG